MQGIAQGLGYTGRVRSPSFVLENRYRAQVLIQHQDLYRLEAPDEEIATGWEENDRSVILVEWSERAGSYPPRWLEVTLERSGTDRRWVHLRWEAGAAVLRDLRLESLLGRGPGRSW